MEFIDAKWRQNEYIKSFFHIADRYSAIRLLRLIRITTLHAANPFFDWTCAGARFFERAMGGQPVRIGKGEAGGRGWTGYLPLFLYTQITIRWNFPTAVLLLLHNKN